MSSPMQEKKVRFQLRPMNTTAFILIVSLLLLVFSSLFPTRAWLQATDTTPTVITLDDATISITTSGDSTKQFFPGDTISSFSSSPKITVPANTLPCWLFVKVEETDTTKNYITGYTMNGFTQYSGNTAYYYKKVEQKPTEQTFYPLSSVKINTTLKNADMSITDGSVKITLKSCAVQSTGHPEASDAYPVAYAKLK